LVVVDPSVLSQYDGQYEHPKEPRRVLELRWTALEAVEMALRFRADVLSPIIYRSQALFDIWFVASGKSPGAEEVQFTDGQLRKGCRR
jgi:hypothetical protein